MARGASTAAEPTGWLLAARPTVLTAQRARCCSEHCPAAPMDSRGKVDSSLDQGVPQQITVQQSPGTGLQLSAGLCTKAPRPHAPPRAFDDETGRHRNADKAAPS